MKLKSPRQAPPKNLLLYPRIPLIIAAIIFLISLPFVVIYSLSFWYRQQGNQFFQEGKLIEAIAAYEKMLPLNVQPSLAYLKIAQIYQKDNNIIAAFNAYQKAFFTNKYLEINNQTIADLIKLGDALQAQYTSSEAIWCYEKALELDPQSLAVYEKLGNILSSHSRWSEAITIYKKALEFSPYNATFYEKLGRAYLEQSDWQNAVNALEKLLTIQPNNQKIYYLLGQAYQEEKDYSKAENYYLKALTSKDKQGNVYYQLGQVLEKQNKLKEAIAAYQEAQKLEPKNGEIDKNLCFAYHQKGELIKAVRTCRQAHAKDPSLGDARFYAQEVERGMIIHNNPQVLKLPERLPTRQQDPLINLKRPVVKVIYRSQGQNSLGTGWLLKKTASKAWIITNRHVATGEDQKKDKQARIFVEFYSLPQAKEVRQRRRARLLHTMPPDHWLDLAVLEIDNPPTNLQPLELGTSAASLGQSVKAIGHPVIGKDWTFSPGEVRKVSKEQVILSMQLASGQSGGPVLQENAQVIAMISQAGLFCSREAAPSLENSFRLGCGVAIPAERIKEQLQEWGILPPSAQN
jgi:superkiller protein 3